VLALGAPAAASAHGIVGKRYFPPAIQVEDPFATDEARFALGRAPRGGDSSRKPEVRTVGGGLEILEGVGIALDATYRSPNDGLAPERAGFDNLALTLKKELVLNEPHEYALTAALVAEAGGTGTRGAPGRSSYLPALFYAKGFGDLPEPLKLLRPLAVTGVLGREFTREPGRPAFLEWGFTLQYSLMYLQSHVGDYGLGAPFDRLVPPVQFPLRTCLDKGCSGQVTGTVNPGFVWVGRHFNLAAQLVRPLNSRSGHGTGMMFQFQMFFSR